MASRGSYGERTTGGFSRRRAIGLAGGAGAAAFLVACGASKNESSGTTKEATREAGVIAGSQSSSAETPKPGGAATFYWTLTPPLDPVVNTTFSTQRLAAFTYPRLLKFKTDKEPRTA